MPKLVRASRELKMQQRNLLDRLCQHTVLDPDDQQSRVPMEDFLKLPTRKELPIYYRVIKPSRARDVVTIRHNVEVLCDDVAFKAGRDWVA
jgi:hypothetical protein